MGADCFRTEDCQEGLVCIENACSNDLTAIESQVDGPEQPAVDPGDAATDAQTPDATAPPAEDASASAGSGGGGGAGGSPAAGAGGAAAGAAGTAAGAGGAPPVDAAAG